MSEQQINKLLDCLEAMILKLEHIESMLLQQSLPQEDEKLAILQQEGG